VVPRSLGGPLSLAPTLLAYFEISVAAGPTPPLDCVAVGLSERAHRFDRKMPGWDRQSYGYHGDDGGIFHGDGDMVGPYGPTFGAGDTVGCGVNFGAVGGASVFFTLGGRFLGASPSEARGRGKEGFDDDIKQKPSFRC
jgi:hypothetical protein